MNRFISKDNISRFCTTNEKYVKGEIKKLVVEFPGFDGRSCLGGDFNLRENSSRLAKILGEKGILSVYVFTGPWNWMKDTAVIIVDHIIGSVKEKFALNEEIPIVAVGGSMGGHGALMYTLRGGCKISACAVSCPVCDLNALSEREEYHYFCASVYQAFADCDGDFQDIVKVYSPLYNIESMPRIPYFMIICDADSVIPSDVHGLPFFSGMKKTNHNIQAVISNGKEHCVHTEECYNQFIEFVIHGI